MRSKLFVPGSRPELFTKALASQADAISIDLEDSVVESLKAEARGHVADFLQSVSFHSSKKVVIVRCNALGTPHFEADIQVVASSVRGVLLNLPKLESAADIHAAVAELERVESAGSRNTPTQIIANIETPRSLRCAPEIATAHPRIVGLQLGLADLFEPLGFERRDLMSVHATMFAVRMAAGVSGVFAYDGAFPDVHDECGFRAEAEIARKLGYLGKSCIHPKQVGLANDVFHFREAEIAHAMRVLEAAQQAETLGNGAFVLDGRMIDAPNIRRAEAIVAASRRFR